MDLVALYSDESARATDREFKEAVQSALDTVEDQDSVAHVVSYYDRGDAVLLSRDGHATYAAITLASEAEQDKIAAYEELRPLFDARGVDTEVGGIVAFQATTDEMTERDIMRGEMITLPAVLVLLTIIFGGLVAAGMLLLVGILAILSAFTTTRLLTLFTEVSTFAVNTVTLLGLGMAIDYSLLIVSRSREELSTGADPAAAVRATLATAGRTVLVSGVTVALSLSSLLVFPQVFLRSMGLGGIAAVTMAMIGSLTILPALLVILGHRIDSLRIPFTRRGSSSPAERSAGRWASFAHSAMRRPIPYVVGVLAFLALVASPFMNAEFSGADERVVPAGTEARSVAESIATEFAGGSVAPIQVYVEEMAGTKLDGFASEIARVPGVTSAAVTDQGGGSALVTAGYEGPRTGDVAQSAVTAIRDLPVPGDGEVLVGGRTAADLDRLSSLGDRLPLMGVLMAGMTFVLLFFAFGSVVLPLKAILMNGVSIAASFGVIVWIFQDGHLADLLGFTPTGFLEPTIPILVLVILFGLSTDYEIFLLSRIREEWDRTHDTRAAVAAGMQRTGGIITSAALLLMVVVAGFATGEVVFAKMIGISMVVAILVDATLVRLLLVPATMRLLDRWNWWAPRPMAALFRRFGLREGIRTDETPTPKAGASRPESGVGATAPAAARVD